eukprot:58185-Pelagomonas_calceolata.AAC.3
MSRCMSQEAKDRGAKKPRCLLHWHEDNRRLCADFHIASYPTIAFGSPEQFLARANVTIHPSSESRDAPSMVAWVGRLMGKLCYM